MTVIGGADGPTAIFVASNGGWFNAFGAALLVFLLLPNVIYALRHKGEKNRCENRAMNLVEQVGRYGCMALMVVNLGVAELGFGSPEGAALYFVGNLALILLYWLFWMLYARRARRGFALMLAVLPTLIFLLCALTLRYWLLAIFAVLFGVGHIYVTSANNLKE